MGLFDGLVTELSSRFGLGDKAGPLLSGLLSLITDSDQGGLTGFLDRLRHGGLGDQVASWVGTGTNATVAPEQLEQALGRDAVERVSASAGVPASTGSSALAFLVPKVVDLLTPGGSVPAGPPTGIGGYLAGAAGLAGAAVGSVRQAGRGVGSAASGLGAAATSGAGAAAASGGSALRKVVPVLLVLLLGFLGYRFLAKRGVTEAPSAMGADTTAMAPAEPAAGAGEMTADSAARAGETAPAAADGGTAAVAGARRNAAAALAGLQPGYGAKELVAALNLNIINFASGKAEIPAESRDILDQSAKPSRARRRAPCSRVGGHTDNTGSAAGNQALSTRRATAVREYLVQHGVAPGSLTAKGSGASAPIADNGTEAGRFKNRRIEFTVAQ